MALARALAAEPALLLLDEPLSALDAATRARTRHELRRMLLASGVPSIVVTHDRMEAVALGDWMAVMVDGRIRQTRTGAGGLPPAGRSRRWRNRWAWRTCWPRRSWAANRGLLTLRVGGARIAVRGCRRDRGRVRLHSRRGCRHHARDGSGVERAQPAGGTRARR